MQYMKIHEETAFPFHCLCIDDMLKCIYAMQNAYYRLTLKMLFQQLKNCTHDNMMLDGGLLYTDAYAQAQFFVENNNSCPESKK